MQFQYKDLNEIRAITLIHRARHLAAAIRGIGPEEVKSNSNIGSGVIMKRLK